MCCIMNLRNRWKVSGYSESGLAPKHIPIPIIEKRRNTEDERQNLAIQAIRAPSVTLHPASISADGYHRRCLL
jgi:hypothetical protein